MLVNTQTSTTPTHTVALIIIEASDRLSHDRLHQLVASSLPQLARFRSRLVDKPLGMGQPVWAEITRLRKSIAQRFAPPAAGPSSLS